MTDRFLTTSCLVGWLLLSSLGSLPARAQWFEGGKPVCTAYAGRSLGEVLPDASGGVYLTWYDYRDHSGSSRPDAYAQHLQADGTIDPSWPSSGLRISDADGSKYPEGLESDGAGGFIVVWSDYRTPLPDSSWALELYASRVTPGGSIAPGWPSQGLRVSALRNYDSPGYTCSDGSGGVYVAWRAVTMISYGQAQDGELRLQRITQNGSVAPGWPADGIVLASGNTARYSAAPIADGSGGLYLFWSPQTGQGHRAVRITADGSLGLGWPAEGLLLSLQPYSSYLSAVPAPSGGFFAFWDEYAGVDPEAGILAIRVESDGALAFGWSAGGVRVSSLGANLPIGCIASTDGGAIVQWGRLDAGFVNLHAQKVMPDGSIPTEWGPDGVTMYSSGNYIDRFAAASDGDGGIYLVFEEARESFPPYHYRTTVFAHHLAKDGSVDPGWPVPYVPLSDPNAHSRNAKIAVLPGCTAVVAWDGYVSGQPGNTIFAQRLRPFGSQSFAIGVVSVDARPDRVRLHWRSSPAAAVPAAVERRLSSGAWESVAVLQPDSAGEYTFEDRGITPGERYGYRLSVATGLQPRTFGDASVTVPWLALGIRASTVQRSGSGLVADIELPTGEQARIALVDVRGRVVDTIASLGSLGAGIHRIRLGDRARLGAGVYFGRVEQGHRVATKRFVLLH